MIRIVFELWNKNSQNTKDSLYFSMNQTAFDMIKSKNNDLGSKILEFILDKNDHDASEEARRMMAVNLAISYKMLNNRTKMLSALERFQWASCSDNFKICIAAIKMEMDEVIRLIPKLKDSNELPDAAFKTWPAFHWAREDERFKSAVREHYGIDIV